MKSASLVLLFLGAAGLSQAQTGVPLLDNWPFAPPGSAQSATTAAPEGPASLAKLQLRGITSVDGEYIFSVYNPDTRESKWLPQGVELDGLVIKSYDSKKNSVVIHSEAEMTILLQPESERLLGLLLRLQARARPTEQRLKPFLPPEHYLAHNKPSNVLHVET
jgi:hypothetical protein